MSVDNFSVPIREKKVKLEGMLSQKLAEAEFAPRFYGSFDTGGRIHHFTLYVNY